MILIGLGANLAGRYGSAEEALLAAGRELDVRGVRVVSFSRIWSSAPVPVSDQPWYKNAAIAVETDLEPYALLLLLKAIEVDFGRVQGERNAPRVLDLDILSYNGDVFNVLGLSLPHPRMHERAFVLYPLREVAPDWVHPVLNLSVDALIKNLSPDQEICLLEKGVA